MKDALLFEEEELVAWKREWQNMPEFIAEDLDAKYQVVVSFVSLSDVEDFARMLGLDIETRDNPKQKHSVWFPAQDKDTDNKNWRYRDGSEA